MKSVYINGHGGNEVVAVGERPKPQRRAGEVLVRMQAATLNRVDLYMRNSGAGIRHALPLIMGVDGAGIVEEVDADETRLAPGQRVTLYPGITCGRCEFCLRGEAVLCSSMQLLGEHRDGTMAEYVSVPAENAFPIPDTLDFAQAAALGVNHLTAWRMLFTKARLQPWETVLIFGIGGGVALAALQLARLVGATTIVTSRHAGKLERAQREFGADHLIDGSREDIARRALELTGGRGVDVVIENVGEAVWSHALKSLVRGGRLVTCGATSGSQPGADLQRMFIRQLQVLGSTMGDRSEFAALLEVCARGRLKPLIEQRYPMGDVHAALARLEAGEQFGKLALTIAE